MTLEVFSNLRDSGILQILKRPRIPKKVAGRQWEGRKSKPSCSRDSSPRWNGRPVGLRSSAKGKPAPEFHERSAKASKSMRNWDFVEHQLQILGFAPQPFPFPRFQLWECDVSSQGFRFSNTFPTGLQYINGITQGKGKPRLDQRGKSARNPWDLLRPANPKSCPENPLHVPSFWMERLLSLPPPQIFTGIWDLPTRAAGKLKQNTGGWKTRNILVEASVR